MNELSRHIEYLLLSHDCVVIPQFGAFVTQWIGATYAAEDSLYIPPQRSVRFNTGILTDDGLLVHSFQHTYNVSEAEAKRKIQTLVLDLRQQMLADGSADFGSLGQFTQDEDGVVSFEACAAGTVTPTYFGLDAFVFPRLQPTAKARLHRNADEVKKPRLVSINDHGDIDIHISHRIIRNVGVAAALVVLFFLLPTHMGMTGLFTPSTATLNPISHETAMAAAPKAVPASTTPVTVSKAAPASTTPATTSSSPATVPSPQAAQQPSPTYAVVLACAIPEKKAESYAAELIAKGLTGVRVMKHGKMVRVVMDGFLTEKRAHEEIANLHERYNEFESAWVMKIEQ